MAIESDDSDIRQTWLKCYFSGNGDPYIEIVYLNKGGYKECTSVRIATSGGNAPTEIKIAVANLARKMDELGLNEHPIDEKLTHEQAIEKIRYNIENSEYPFQAEHKRILDYLRTLEECLIDMAEEKDRLLDFENENQRLKERLTNLGITDF